MALRLRKSIKILPGVSLNLSRSGVSASVGPRGAKVSIGTRGARATVGIPGTGVSYSQKLGGPSADECVDAAPAAAPGFFSRLFALVVAALAFGAGATLTMGLGMGVITVAGIPSRAGSGVMLFVGLFGLVVGFWAARRTWRHYMTPG